MGLVPNASQANSTSCCSSAVVGSGEVTLAATVHFDNQRLETLIIGSNKRRKTPKGQCD